MALLEEAANLGHAYTGGFDGLDSLSIAPLFGVFEFNPLYPADPVSLRPRRALPVLRLRAHAGLFALRPEPDGDPREHAAHARGGGAGARAARRLLRALGGHRRAWPAASGPRPMPTSTSAPSASTARPPVLIILVLGGHGRLYGAFIGRRRLHGALALPGQDLPDRLAARAGVAARGHRALRAQRHRRDRQALRARGPHGRRARSDTPGPGGDPSAPRSRGRRAR